jgi:hypothetical protein
LALLDEELVFALSCDEFSTSALGNTFLTTFNTMAGSTLPKTVIFNFPISA